MDGFKKRMSESIQLRLSFSLALAILVVAIAAGIFSFMSAFDEANELQDDVLRQVASIYDRQHLPIIGFSKDSQAQDDDAEFRVIVQYLADGDGKALGNDEYAPLPLPTTLSDGLHTLDVGGEPFRVLVKTMASKRRIALAQEASVRDEIARDSALRSVIPLLILVPILLLVVADLVRKIFLPITALSVEIDQRAEQELHPVKESHLPAEIRPFVVAINRLLNRVEQSMDTQRRFVADAAHELRSPLTALSLQAERLAEADMSSQAQARLVLLRRGIERSRNLLDQLLTLAKAQTALDLPRSAVSVLGVYRHVLEDLLPLAEAKHIDIGVEGDLDVWVLVHEFDLITVIKNLVDNAIRYTPNEGRVDLSVAVEGQRARLQIKDSGPGISVNERLRVFDPFYRTLGSDQVGSGLGLSIVSAIAQRIGADVELGFSDVARETGLCISLLLSAAAPLAATETGR
ncbi:MULTISPECIES: ATP-binding protein [unclassified Pseudomonas]|uniref:sensor histidine kinase n=1 Tax=unclassified Pseudomonas TaxID=196821 RepID=UPI002AC9E7B2|nr:MULTISPECIES: ATP-binding protein [unclassified Pseudomonas]MEB0040711.1 ATP-binding protein [Pseudomonas sp. MH10]MEB0078610.1 ATP-binding protein [Pseudomonas sp. MH10out]MEB0091652.1 ATP-binding protein [Pseudomonas sp. CCI4.2]MEB0099945.1 ATP-binding protein [Pseudomonas sp. CCI3.2]MEB0123189.1 ATP-binding protein [Pseudomonas sp. CCI1.2]